MLTAQSGFEWAPPEVAHLWRRPGHKGAARRNHTALRFSWIGRLPLRGNSQSIPCRGDRPVARRDRLILRKPRRISEKVPFPADVPPRRDAQRPYARAKTQVGAQKRVPGKVKLCEPPAAPGLHQKEINTNAINFFTFHCEREDHGHFTPSPPSPLEEEGKGGGGIALSFREAPYNDNLFNAFVLVERQRAGMCKMGCYFKGGGRRKRVRGECRNPHAALCISILLGSVLFLIPSFAQNASSQNLTTQLLRQSRFIMGTSVEITVSRAEPAKAEEAIEAAFQEVERLNVLLSHYRPDSEVSQITRYAGEKGIRVSPETLEVIERALYFSRLSEGAFDITIGSVFRLWNFREGKIPDDRSLRENLKRVDYRKIKVDRARSSVFLEDRGMELDLGAIGKGYAVDLACGVLLKKGMESFLVKAGGEIKAHGEKEAGVPWIIGIQHPRLSSHILAKLKVRNAAISTSGDYEKFFLKEGERYHHILNPSTGMPAQECQSVTIMAPTSMDADALATAVFVLGSQKGFPLIEKLPNVQAMIVNRRGNVLVSPHWPEGVLAPP